MRIEEEIKQPKFRNDCQKAVVNLIYTANWLETVQEDLFKPFGITSSQFNILRILRGQNGKSLSGAEIKSRMLERNSDISRMLDRMVKKDLVSKSECPNDKRATNVSISKNGLALLLSIDKHIDMSERSNVHLTQKEARLLSQLLDKARG